MNPPEVLYLDTDSEITEAIDKLKAAKADEVRLVAPARSSILQSAVNLKLLKKAASDHNKKLVLVSGDKTTLGLAGALGVAVASSVKAEAAVPEAPEAATASNEPIEINGPEPEPEPSSAADAGEATATASGGIVRKRLSKDRSVQAPPSGKKVKVPKFDKLNKKILVGVGIAAVFLLLILAYVFLPTGKVILTAKANKTPVSFQFTADSGTSQSNFAAGQIAAQKLEANKDLSATYDATGKKDVGSKASGQVKFTNANSSNSVTISAGTVLSSGGKNFSLDSTVNVPGATVQGGSIVAGSANGNITATQNGDSYNMSSATFAVSGYGGIGASGSTSGGSSKTVTVVTADDIANAQKTALAQAESGNKQEVASKASNQQTVLSDSYRATVVNSQPSAAVGAEAGSGTLNIKVAYTVFAANNKDLDGLFDAQVKTKIPGGTQIYQNGRADARYTNAKLVGDSRVQLTADTSAYYGDTIDTTQVAKDAAGKAKKDVSDKVKSQYPQTTNVQVETTPALDPNMPFFSSRIKVEIIADTSG
ncbi:hypothetical protein HYX70_05240 [Candidatus Saccharibacteria bacterium]|nr:hypothetical protein [Candidatus Saccharibacteria bacterium]